MYRKKITDDLLFGGGTKMTAPPPLYPHISSTTPTRTPTLRLGLVSYTICQWADWLSLLQSDLNKKPVHSVSIAAHAHILALLVLTK